MAYGTPCLSNEAPSSTAFASGLSVSTRSCCALLRAQSSEQLHAAVRERISKIENALSVGACSEQTLRVATQHVDDGRPLGRRQTDVICRLANERDVIARNPGWQRRRHPGNHAMAWHLSPETNDHVALHEAWRQVRR